MYAYESCTISESDVLVSRTCLVLWTQPCKKSDSWDIYPKTFIRKKKKID